MEFVSSGSEPGDYGSSYEHHTSPTELLDELADDTMLRRLPSLKEAAALAVVAASDHGASLTATAINLTAGSVAD